MPRFEKVKRLIQERSHLTLEFPQSKGRVIRTFIPFLENPVITERGRSNLNSYKLVGRNGELFSYAGADSRKFSLTFNLSLLHIIAMDAEEGITDKFKRQFNLFFTDRESAKSYFGLKRQSDEIGDRDLFKDLQLGRSATSIVKREAVRNEGRDQLRATSQFDFPVDDTGGFGRDHASIHRAYYQQAAGIITNDQESGAAKTFSGYGARTTNVNGSVRQDGRSEAVRALADADHTDINKYIDLMLTWINLIRGSVLNRSDNTVYGPPIVRLTHGTMHNNVPCLVEDYNISVVHEAGYEAQTLTPKRFEIQLNLVETRTGDFGDYVPGEVIAGDNLTGWESIISNNDIDPYNGLIGADKDNYGI